MIVLSEAPEQVSPNASARELGAVTEAARLVGFRVYTIPPDFERCGTAENALAHVPPRDTTAPGVWVGYIPTPDRYAAIYMAPLDKGIRLLNTPAQHRTAMEFDGFYPLLEGLTPRSVVIRAVEECAAAGEMLGYPVFVKGVVQSRKARGWRACVAENLGELERLAANLLELDNRSRGRVVVRELARLRHARTSGQGFPAGREFRYVVYDGRVLARGYYWDGDDPLAALSPAEEASAGALVGQAAERLGVPYAAIDVGQLEGGEWTVIEAGDAQFAGHSQIPLLTLWSRLREAIADGNARNGL